MTASHPGSLFLPCSFDLDPSPAPGGQHKCVYPRGLRSRTDRELCDMDIQTEDIFEVRVISRI